MMNEKIIIAVVGTRPNFVKMKTVVHFLSNQNFKVILVHTGQHFDRNMSESFFDDLELPEPDYYLGINTGSTTEQLSKIMVEFEKVCLQLSPELVVVAGDVNSTLACAITAVNNNIKIAHVESGLRSSDKTMPEEINRIITDNISDILFVTEQSGLDNLKKEGFDFNNVHFVGNSMIDSLIQYRDKALKLKPWKKYGLKRKNYCLVTLHRPSNVDKMEDLLYVIKMLNEIAKKIDVLFPVHPRTKVNLEKISDSISSSIKIIDPLSYLNFLGIMSSSLVILTDSGGIQEESTYLGVQCLTFRKNTERPITITCGTNELVGTDQKKTISLVGDIINGRYKKGKIPEKWDGNAGERIALKIKEFLSK